MMAYYANRGVAPRINLETRRILMLPLVNMFAALAGIYSSLFEMALLSFVSKGCFSCHVPLIRGILIFKLLL